MPRIRKKTSKRGTLHQRAKIRKKVQETHRKQKRQAKKNPPKKSKPKDPGIPNSFPFKDQILAEVAEQRRQAAEEKQRRKEERKAAKAGQADDASDASGDEGNEGMFDGVVALKAAARAGPAQEDAMDADEASADEEVEDAPMLVNPDLPNLKAVLDAADIVLEVLDARDPLASRSAHVEEVGRESGKRVLLVLNKVDLCPKEAVEAWASTLRKEHPTVLFRSASACLPAPAESVKGKGKERADDAWGLEPTLSLLKQWASEKKDDKPFAVAVVGVTNAGKSSVVNSLLRRAALPTYKLATASPDSPTTTTHPQEVTLELDGKAVRFIDTPGLSWHRAEDTPEDEVQRARARDVLLRNRGRIERLKDPSHVMAELVSRANREDLMLLYNLPIFMEGDANAFLAGVARANNFTKKKSELDLNAASRHVLRDWSSGKFARYSMPPASASASTDAAATAPSDPALSEVYAKDSEVLARLSTRKELRKAGALVKLRAGALETRRTLLDESYFADSGDEADEEEDGAGSGSGESDLDEEETDEEDEVGSDEEDELDEEDDEEDEDEEEDEEEQQPPSPHGKRKRSASSKAAAPARPSKKVAFAPEPKGTKQARSAAGAKGAILKAQLAKKKSSSSSSSVKAVAPAAKPAAQKKVANSSAGKKGASAASAAKDGEVAYDFKQFF